MSGYQEPAGGIKSNPSGTRFGSKPIRATMLLLAGSQLATHPGYGATYEPKIDTPFRFYSERLRLLNTAGTFESTIIQDNITQDQDIHIPILTNVVSSQLTDEVMFLKQTSEVNNKTIPITGVGTNIILDPTADSSNIAGFDDDGHLIKVDQISDAGLPSQLVRTDESNTYDDFAQIFRSGQIHLRNPANTFSYIRAGGAIVADRTITEPVLAANDVPVYQAHAQPIDNKTIDTITNIVKYGTIYSKHIAKVGSTYYMLDITTGVVTSNASANVIFQAAMDVGGDVYVHAADYYITAGCNMPYNPIQCRFTMDIAVNIIVPNGYTSYAFGFKTSATGVDSGYGVYGNVLEGGNIKEDGTPAQNWTAIRFQATDVADPFLKGVYGNVVQNIEINRPLTGIEILIEADSTDCFITDNKFREVFIWHPINGVWFNRTPTVTQGRIARNRFTHITVQMFNNTSPPAGIPTATGFRDITGEDNTFIGCYPVDFTGSQKTATIHADATNTLIIGGSMKHLNFVDNSTAKSTTTLGNSPELAVINLKAHGGSSIGIVPTSGNTITVSWWKPDLTERFYISRSDTSTLFDFVAQAGGTLRPAIFRMNEVGGSGGIESFRIEIDSGLLVANNKLKLHDAGGNHSVAITVPDLAANRNLAIPLLTEDDTFLTADFPNVLTKPLTITLATTTGTTEAPLTIGTSDTTDAFTLTNQYSTDGRFNPMFRSTTTSAVQSTAAHSMYFQGVILDTHDSGSAPILVFGAKRSGDVQVVRPMLGIRNLNTDIFLFRPNRLDLAEAVDLQVGTTTGTKLGTATTQKIGFHNATPTAQNAFIASPDTTGAQLKTAVDAIRTWMINKGFMAAS